MPFMTDTKSDGGSRDALPVPTDNLVTLIREYAHDLRRNSSGGDDYPWEYAKATADYLEVLIQRAALKAQSPEIKNRPWDALAERVGELANCVCDLSPDEMANRLVEISAALKAQPDKGEPVAWLYEILINDVHWTQRYSDTKPSVRPYHRNFRPLYLAAPQASDEVREALEAALAHIKLNHKSTAWHNDPQAWKIIKEVIEPALAAYRLQCKGEQK
jgi:hypothetical protein